MPERNLLFDEITDRKGTGCLKYDFAVQRGMPADILPLWVADMDFPTSSYILDAVKKRTDHGIFGYSEPMNGYFEALKGWMKTRHNWDIEDDWVLRTPGVVFALAMAIRAYTEPGDGVMIQLPVYYPFSEVIEDNDRKVVSNTLVLGEDGHYRMDLADFEEKIKREHIKLFILCSPHNPVGRVWTKEELLAVGDLCVKYGVTVVSDEIHHDFVFHGEHSVFAGLKPEFADITVTCTAPSKTFNIAGMVLSNIIISDPDLRKAFKKQMNAAGISQLNPLSLTACEAAYRDGGEWYEAMLEYVRENIEFIRTFTEERLPGVRMIPHEGTYLVWLDFRKAGLSTEELEELIIRKAGLWLDSGKIFGDSGKGFQRINAATQRSVLREALERIERALSDN